MNNRMKFIKVKIEQCLDEPQTNNKKQSEENEDEEKVQDYEWK